MPVCVRACVCALFSAFPYTVIRAALTNSSGTACLPLSQVKICLRSRIIFIVYSTFNYVINDPCLFDNEVDVKRNSNRMHRRISKYMFYYFKAVWSVPAYDDCDFPWSWKPLIRINFVSKIEDWKELHIDELWKMLSRTCISIPDTKENRDCALRHRGLSTSSFPPYMILPQSLVLPVTF